MDDNLTLEQRLAKRDIEWQEPRGHEQMSDVFRRAVLTMIKLMDQIDRDYPRPERKD